MPRNVQNYKRLGAALLYGFVSSSLTFANKALPSSFDFNYPLFVLMVQMLFLQILLLLVGAAGLLKIPKITTRGLLLHVPVSFLYSLNAGVALAALQAVSIPTYGVLKRAGPLFVMLITGAAKQWHNAYGHGNDQSSRAICNFEPVVGADTDGATSREGNQVKTLREDLEVGQVGEGAGEKLKKQHEDAETGPGITAGVVIIVVGAFMTGHSDLYLTRGALVLSAVSNITQSLYVLMVEAKHKGKAGIGREFYYGEDVDPTTGLLYYNSILSLPTLVLFTFILYTVFGREIVGFLDVDYSSPLVLNVMLAAALGIALNYSMFLCIRHNSALTATMVGHIKTLCSTVLGFFILSKDVHASPLYVLGVAFSFVGGYLFTMAKYHESCRSDPVGPWTWDWWRNKYAQIRANLVR